MPTSSSGGFTRVVGVSVGLLALSGLARGESDASPTPDAGADGGEAPLPEPTTTVCLCAVHDPTPEEPPVPLRPALDAVRLRTQVLAGLPADVRARLERR